MNYLFNLCLLLLVSFALSSCALQQVVIKSKEIRPLRNMEKNISMTKAKGSLNILTFSDRREDKESIGEAATGMFNFPAPLLLDVPLNDYITDEFTNQLGKRGIEVAAPAKYSIVGSIKKLWISENADGLSFEFSKCDMIVDFIILNTKTKQPIYQGTANVFAMGTNSIWDTTESNGSVLMACASGFAEHFIKNSGVQQVLGLKIL